MPTISLASSSDSALLVYQNRDTNELYYSESDSHGMFDAPSRIAGTGAVDEPSFWDNSGFSDVTLAWFGGRTFIACTDDIAQKVVVLWKDDLSSTWNREEISPSIDSYFWAFPKFAISSSGILGISYRGNSGTVFAFTEYTSPQSWTSLPITTSTPSSSASMELMFSSATDAHVYIRYGGSYRISTENNAVSSEAFPSLPTSDLTEEEIEKVESTYRSESLYNVRLSDGRILIVLASSGRIYAAVEDE